MSDSPGPESVAGVSLPADFASFQYQIYAGGLIEQTPALPVSAGELQERAREKLGAGPYGYVAGGAGSERTMQANLDAFERRRIVPRMLRDVSERDLSTTVLGTPMPAPLMLAPVGVQSIVHPEGELASSRAAAALGLVYIHSTAASHSIEQVAEAMGEGRRWYQLYWPRERELAASFVGRAERAGYEAVVLTLDTWFLGWRPRDLKNAYLPVPEGRWGGQLLQRPRVPGRPGEAARGGPRRGGRPLGLPVRQPDGQLGGPGVAERADRPAGRAEGDRAR